MLGLPTPAFSRAGFDVVCRLRSFAACAEPCRHWLESLRDPEGLAVAEAAPATPHLAVDTAAATLAAFDAAASYPPGRPRTGGGHLG